MEILVVTPHTDDFIYGVGGTLITHADDDIHIVAVSSIQQSAARDVAAAFGATIEFLDAPYHRISDHAQRVKDALAGILRERRPPTSSDRPRPATGPPTTRRSAGSSSTPPTWRARSPTRAASCASRSPRRRSNSIPTSGSTCRSRIAQRKIELAAVMTRGLEDEWPKDLVEWEVDLGLRYALDIGWPSRHAEASMPSSPCPSTGCRHARSCRASRSGWAARSMRSSRGRPVGGAERRSGRGVGLMSPVGMGLIGSGYMGRTYAACLTRHVPDGRLVSVWGGTRAPALAEEFGVEADDSLAALLARPEIEAVVITSPAHGASAAGGGRRGRRQTCLHREADVGLGRRLRRDHRRLRRSRASSSRSTS